MRRLFLDNDLELVVLRIMGNVEHFQWQCSRVRPIWGWRSQRYKEVIAILQHPIAGAARCVRCSPHSKGFECYLLAFGIEEPSSLAPTFRDELMELSVAGVFCLGALPNIGATCEIVADLSPSGPGSARIAQLVSN